MTQVKNAVSKEKAEAQVEEAIDYQVVEGDQIDFVRLQRGGGDIWLIQLDGSEEGIDYEFDLSKLVKITSQITKRTVTYDEDDQRYFTYATVISSQGMSLRLPLSEGLYLTHYNRYCDAKGKIDPNHSMDDLKIAFTVSFETKNGKVQMDDEGRPKKKVSNVVYTELVTAQTVY